jgi:predicted Ser/Thr protein kinase
VAEDGVPGSGDGAAASDPSLGPTLTRTAEIDAAPGATAAGPRGGDRSGEQLGPFTLLSKLGEGGMGVVYAAEDTRLGRTVALKILPPAALASPDKRRRFLREARAASAVMHPGIAAVFEVGEHGGEVFLAMERVEGRTLRAVLRERGGPLPVERALAVVRDLARALEHAHGAGVVHRDLKPENLMETPSGAVKLLDFGLAKRLGAELPAAAAAPDMATVEGKILGTPGYMAPEQIRGAEVDARTDLFALGVLLFELLTDQLPFEAPTILAMLAATERDPARVPSSLRAEVPPSADAIVARCLQKRPSDRFASAADLATALDEALAGSSAAPPPPSPERAGSTPSPAAPTADAVASRASGERGGASGEEAARGRPAGGASPARWGVGAAAVAVVAAVAVWRARAVEPPVGGEVPAVSLASASGPASSAAPSGPVPAPVVSSAPEPAASGLRRRPCLEGDRGRAQCATKDVIAWCDEGGALLACCGRGLVPKGAEGICGCAPGGTNVAEARSRGCAAVPASAADRYKEVKGKAVEAAIQCFLPIAKEQRAGGTFAADFFLTPEGEVFGARVERCTLPDEGAQRCALEALRSARFPPPPAEESGQKQGFGFVF